MSIQANSKHRLPPPPTFPLGRRRRPNDLQTFTIVAFISKHKSPHKAKLKLVKLVNLTTWTNNNDPLRGICVEKLTRVPSLQSAPESPIPIKQKPHTSGQSAAAQSQKPSHRALSIPSTDIELPAKYTQRSMTPPPETLKPSQIHPEPTARSSSLADVDKGRQEQKLLSGFIVKSVLARMKPKPVILGGLVRIRVCWVRKALPSASNSGLPSSSSQRSEHKISFYYAETGELILEAQSPELDKVLNSQLLKMGYQKFVKRSFALEFVEDDYITFELEQIIPKTTVIFNQVYEDLLPADQIVTNDGYFSRSISEEDRFLFYLWQLQMRELRIDSRLIPGMKSPTVILTKNVLEQDKVRWNLTMIRSFWRDYFERTEKQFRLVSTLFGETYASEKCPKLMYSTTHKLMTVVGNLHQHLKLIIDFLVDPVLSACGPFVGNNKMEADMVHIRGQKYPTHSGGLFATEDLYGQRVDAAVASLQKFKLWIAPLQELEAKKDLAGIWNWRTHFPIETLLMDHLHQGLIALWDKSKVVGQTVIAGYAEFLTQLLATVDPKQFVRKECQGLSLKMIPTPIPIEVLSQATRQHLQGNHIYDLGKPSEAVLSSELVHDLTRQSLCMKLLPPDDWKPADQQSGLTFDLNGVLCMINSTSLSFSKMGKKPKSTLSLQKVDPPSCSYKKFSLAETWTPFRIEPETQLARVVDLERQTIVECSDAFPYTLMITHIREADVESPDFKFSKPYQIVPGDDWEYFTPGGTKIREFTFWNKYLIGLVGFDPENYFYFVKYKLGSDRVSLKHEVKKVIEVAGFNAREDPASVVATKYHLHGLQHAPSIILVRKVLGRSAELLKIRPCIKYMFLKLNMTEDGEFDTSVVVSNHQEFADYFNLSSIKCKQNFNSEPRIVEIKNRVFILDASILYTPLLFCLHRRRFIKIQNRNKDLPNPFELLDMVGPSVQLVQPTCYPLLYSKRSKFFSTNFTEHKFYSLAIKY